MAHQIFGERFLERESRRPAWHGLGQTIQEDEPVNVSQAMEILTIDYSIDQHETFFTANDRNGLLQSFPTGKLVNVRSATGDEDPLVLGTVGKGYKMIQPLDLASKLHPITERMKVETIGALKGGKGLFFTFRVENVSKIAGEEHVLYWLVYDTYDGSGSLTMAFVPVRVVCQNTLNAALSSSKLFVDIPHTGKHEEDVDLFTKVFAQMSGVQDRVVDEMNAMANTSLSLSDIQIDRILRMAYPDAPQPRSMKYTGEITPDDVDANLYANVAERQNESKLQWSKDQETILNHRDGAKWAYNQFNNEFPQLARTPWAIYNAVVETEDFRKGLSPEGNMTTFIKGDRVAAKQKAYAAALEYVGS